MLGSLDLGRMGVAFATSFGACGLFIGTRGWHIRHTSRQQDVTAVQAAHEVPTPRIGGVALAFSMAVVLLYLVPESLRPTTMLFALTCLPVFLAGVAEDLGHGVSPGGRLLAAAISSALAVALLGQWIEGTGLPLFGWIFGVPVAAILLTVLWTSGLCHAFNLIDGVNGLASGVAILLALALAGIARQAGDPLLASMIVMLIGALLGFFVCNWPYGKIFLGDGGAYTIGHVLGWLAIILAGRNPQFSVAAMVLLFFWPVADTLFAIWRRIARKRPTYLPDQLHYHQVVMRGLEILSLGRGRRSLANALTAPILLPFAGAPMLAGFLLWDRPEAALAALLIFGIAFVASYTALVRFLYHRGRTPIFRARLGPLAQQGAPASSRVSR